MRLIDADMFKMEDFRYCLDCDSVMQVIKYAPTIEAEPVHHAIWELVEYKCTPLDTDQTLVCTNCGFAHQHDAWFNRCPNCGARMDGEG